MRRLLTLIFALFWSLSAIAQQQLTIFEKKSDSVAFEGLQSAFQLAMKASNRKAMDSLSSLVSRFLQQHPYHIRIVYRPNARYTQYGALAKVTSLDSISKLSVNGRGRRTLPDSIYLLSNLERLELINFKLRKIPRKLFQKTNIKQLTILNNFPTRRLRIAKSNKLTKLTIHGDEDGMLPTRFRHFPRLDTLNLSNNDLTYFPDVARLTSLRFLNLGANKITLEGKTLLPPNLVSLDLSRNLIKVVPKSIGNAAGLLNLDFANNQIEWLEPGLSRCKSLERLSFYRNKLRSLPPELYELKNLKEIDLYYNELTSIDTSISQWRDLEILYLSNNKLTSIPDQVGRLNHLQELYLHHNRLSTLPQSIAGLKSLLVLRANDNVLIEWPTCVNGLTQLTNLDLSSNRITTLPIDALHFEQIKIIALAKNPWDAATRDALARWLNQLAANGTTVYQQPTP